MVRKFLFIFLMLCVTGPAIAESAEVTTQANEIYGEVLSPFCPGRLLSDCPSGAASKLKTEIRTRLEAGDSKEEVIQHLYTLYGDEIRAAPEFKSFGMVAWLTPALFLFAGFGLIAYWLARNAATRETDSDETFLL